MTLEECHVLKSSKIFLGFYSKRQKELERWTYEEDEDEDELELKGRDRFDADLGTLRTVLVLVVRTCVFPSFLALLTTETVLRSPPDLDRDRDLEWEPSEE